MPTDPRTLLLVVALVLAVLSLLPGVAVALTLSVILICVALLIGRR